MTFTIAVDICLVALILQNMFIIGVLVVIARHAKRCANLADAIPARDLTPVLWAVGTAAQDRSDSEGEIVRGVF